VGNRLREFDALTHTLAVAGDLAPGGVRQADLFNAFDASCPHSAVE